jgi:hypothetical protein
VRSVGLAVERNHLDIEFGAYGAHRVLAEREHGFGEHPPAVLGTKTISA